MAYNVKGNDTSTVSEYFMTINTSPGCLCYGSRIAPTINIGEYPEASMCFSSACDNTKYIDGFDLTDKNCSQYCPIVTEWVTSKNKATKSMDLDDLDSVKYTRVCGNHINPYSLGTFNLEILCIGIGVSLTLMFILFLSLKNNNISTGKHVLYLTITGILTLGISIFLAFDLQGQPECDKTEPICKSRITGIPINEQYCNFMLGCECESGNECDKCAVNDAGICASGVCASNERELGTIAVTDINYTYLVTSCILIVLLPLVIYTLSTSFVKLNNNKVLLTLIPLSVIIPSLLLMLKTFNRYNKTIFMKMCDGNATDLSKNYANWNNVIIPVISTGIIIMGISVYLLHNTSKKNIYTE